MPPNTTSGSILDRYECSYKKVANPYSETKNACFEECPGSSGHRNTREHEASEQLADDTTRVTTRARLTYELYKYSKNAMLIVTDAPFQYHDTIEVLDLKRTFKKFRFEVDVVTVGTVGDDKAELYDKCGQFFRRDFTDYGAVALVILTHMGVNHPPIPGLERRLFEESVIMDNFKLERNPTLADKPKIYITKVVRSIFKPLYDHFNGLDNDTYGDVIGFHSDAADTFMTLKNYIREKGDTEIIPEDVLSGPLKIFCQKLAAMGDNVTLTDIIAQTIEDSKAKYTMLNPGTETVFGAVNTLRKELYFARVEEN